MSGLVDLDKWNGTVLVRGVYAYKLLKYNPVYEKEGIIQIYINLGLTMPEVKMISCSDEQIL